MLQGAHLTPIDVLKVNPSFFEVFDLWFVYGDQALALASHDGLMMTRKQAKQDFGDVDPIGGASL